MAGLADCTEQMNIFLISSLFAISICINPYLDYIIILRLCVSCYLEVLGPHSGPWCHLLPCQRGWIGLGEVRGPGGWGGRGQDRDERFHISEVSEKCFRFFQPHLETLGQQWEKYPWNGKMTKQERLQTPRVFHSFFFSFR